MILFIALIVNSLKAPSSDGIPDQSNTISGETVITYSIIISSLAVLFAYFVIKFIKYYRRKKSVKDPRQSVGFSSDELQTLEREMNYSEIASG